MSIDIIGIVFSKDRAMQLDATLKSFYLNCLDPQQVRLKVLYSASSELALNQYKKLQTEIPGVDFILQGDFKADLCSMLGIPASWWQRIAIKLGIFRKIASPYIIFLVDDNIFVRNFQLSDIINALKKEKKSLGFAMQLGVNLNYCYPLDIQIKFPLHEYVFGDIIKYRWVEAGPGLNYPLEVSSSVYRWKEIAPMVAWLGFSSPNTLESQMVAKSGSHRRSHPDLLCYKQSVTFCNPINKVQSIYNNRSGGNLKYSSDTLAHLYENGVRINTVAYQGLKPISCHQEAELFFVDNKETGL